MDEIYVQSLEQRVKTLEKEVSEIKFLLSIKTGTKEEILEIKGKLEKDLMLWQNPDNDSVYKIGKIADIEKKLELVKQEIG